MFLNPLLKDTFYFTTYGRSPGREGNEEGDRGLSIQLIRNLSQTDCEGHIVPRGAERAVAERKGGMQRERRPFSLFPAFISTLRAKGNEVKRISAFCFAEELCMYEKFYAEL